MADMGPIRVPFCQGGSPPCRAILSACSFGAARFSTETIGPVIEWGIWSVVAAITLFSLFHLARLLSIIQIWDHDELLAHCRTQGFGRAITFVATYAVVLAAALALTAFDYFSKYHLLWIVVAPLIVAGGALELAERSNRLSREERDAAYAVGGVFVLVGVVSAVATVHRFMTGELDWWGSILFALEWLVFVGCGLLLLLGAQHATSEFQKTAIVEPWRDA